MSCCYSRKYTKKQVSFCKKMVNKIPFLLKKTIIILQINENYFIKLFTISAIAPFDPKTKASNAISTITTSLTIFQLYFPKPLSQNVRISIKTGTISPNIEKQNAPIKETKGTISGTATASRTLIVTRVVLRP